MYKSNLQSPAANTSITSDELLCMDDRESPNTVSLLSKHLFRFFLNSCAVCSLSVPAIWVFTNFGLHADVCRGVHADPQGLKCMTEFTSYEPLCTRGCRKHEFAVVVSNAAVRVVVTFPGKKHKWEWICHTWYVGGLQLIHVSENGVEKIKIPNIKGIDYPWHCSSSTLTFLTLTALIICGASLETIQRNKIL